MCTHTHTHTHTQTQSAGTGTVSTPALPDFLPKEGQQQSSDCLPHISHIPQIPAADLKLRLRCSPTDTSIRP